MKNTMTSKILYLTSGKKYELSILLEIQIDFIKAGNEVLKATIYPFGVNATYYWESEINPYGYEVYIKFYCLYFLFKALYFGDDIGLSSNYINSYYSLLCWSIIDLKRLEISINSTLNNLVKNPHIIDISKLPTNIVYSKEIINYEVNINYYFFYLKEGIGEINNMLFSEEGSIIIIYTEEIIGNINITSLTDFVEYHYFKERKSRVQTITEFYHPIKFIVQKDSPIEFYAIVDGTMDVTFNIQIFKIQMEQIYEEDDDLFEIIAYIINDEELDRFYNNRNYQPNQELYSGLYDKNLKIGEITIKKEDISIYLSSNYSIYVYIIVKKNSRSKAVYNYIEGQILFSSQNYFYSITPQDFCVYNKITKFQSNPHLYTFIMEKLYGKYLIIEFESPSNELDCKILKYKNYTINSEELYIDYKGYNITRRSENNKTYIYVYQYSNNKFIFEYIIVSIFYKKESHSTKIIKIILLINTQKL